jgi:PAS domain S-box-containing protein
MTIHRAIFCIFWMLLAMALYPGAPSPANAASRSIRVVMDDNYPPFTFKDSNGRQQGILIDQWRLWEQKTGIKVEISAMDWGKAISLMMGGKFDVIDTIFKTEERATWLDFSHPYAELEVPIFFDKGISGITDVNSLKGFAVAVKSGDAAIEILKNNGIDSLVLFNSYEAIIRAAQEHKVNVFVVDKPPALYFLYKFGIIDRYKVSHPLYIGKFHRAVKKGNSGLLKQVEDGFNLIPAGELKNIETKWYGSTPYDSRLLNYFLIVSASLALLLFILFAWNHTLRKKVAVRTAELKTSMETLRANAAFITTLMNAIPVPIFYKDKEGSYLGFNNAFEELYGKTKEEIIGKNVFDLFPRELAEVYHGKDLEILQDPGTRIYESQLKNAQGVVRDVIFHKASITDMNGQVSGLIGAILDITERKQITRSLAENETRLRTLVNTIPDLVWLKDADGVYLSCNPMFERLYGAREADIVGKTDYDFVDRELADFFREHDRIAVETGKPCSNEEWVTFADDGHKALLNTIKSPMFDAEGGLIGVLGIAHDITEIKNAETERLELERQLLHSQKLESLGVLSGGIAHDFNNLLLAILGNLDLALLNLPDDAAVRRNIDQAVIASKHAAKLTGMMLAYSGKGNFIIKELNLTELVKENANMLSAAIPKSVNLDLQLDHSLPPVMADAGQVQQVVMNLITNAAEAICKDNGTITLSTGVQKFDQATLNSSRVEEKLAAGRYVWMEVSDNGCGMDEDTLQKLFDPFFTTKFTGRGLGMSAVLGIIRAHKGAFLVKSKPGAGTTMLVVLPIASHAQAEEAISKAATNVSPADSCQFSGVVMIVDDEELVRRVSVNMMGALGFQTLVASDGEEALSMFREHGEMIGLVLLDQSMPGMDGVSVFRELRKIKQDIKVLLASGYSEEEVSERFTGLGLSGFIHKPFNLHNLSSEVQRVLALT